MPTVGNFIKKEKQLLKHAIPQRRSPEKNNADRSVSKSQPEPIRLNVRRTIKDQLMARIREAQAAALSTDNSEWLSENEVEHFVKRVESEMYHSFGRDVSAKYKSKYRSLMFNIKDRKNKTLFEKICAKQVDPKQLVRMTPAELASQELAKWREEENRHQLDMIKKSELDLLSCAQNYVVKTHKGEEVIETKLDVTLPDEELEKEPNKGTTESSDGKKSLQSHELSVGSDVSGKETDVERSIIKEKSSKSRNKDRVRGLDRERDKQRHKSHKNHYQSGMKRSRSRSSSRGRSSEKRSHKRHHHDHNSDKEKEQVLRDKHSSKERNEKIQSPRPKKSAEKKTTEPALAFSLIDQILESEKTVEQAANLKQSVKQTLKSTPASVNATPKVATKPTPPLDKYERYLQSLASPALWTGNLHMVDVTDFNIVINTVCGDTNQLGKLLPISLDVIGRIARNNVWDYLKKIKKSPTKEIVIVNLFPASSSDTINFESFFEYLDTRERLGVLGADCEQIRDFYIFPLGGHDKLPSVLQSSDIVPFYEDTQRPNTLLGIIVRCLPNRLANLSKTLPITLPTTSNKTVKVR